MGYVLILHLRRLGLTGKPQTVLVDESLLRSPVQLEFRVMRIVSIWQTSYGHEIGDYRNLNMPCSCHSILTPFPTHQAFRYLLVKLAVLHHKSSVVQPCCSPTLVPLYHSLRQLSINQQNLKVLFVCLFVFFLGERVKMWQNIQVTGTCYSLQKEKDIVDSRQDYLKHWTKWFIACWLHLTVWEFLMLSVPSCTSQRTSRSTPTLFSMSPLRGAACGQIPTLSKATSPRMPVKGPGLQDAQQNGVTALGILFQTRTPNKTTSAS